MADIHSKKTRSYNMSRIKGKNTKSEILVRKFLHKNGYRYRLNYSILPGKPDIALPKYKTVIFVNGCFWHGHEDCKNSAIPKTNSKWWSDKIKNTMIRDRKNEKELHELGWNVIIVWSCQLKKNNQNTTLNKLPQRILSYQRRDDRQID